MQRIVKKHDVRRNELLDVAQMLFFKKGYDNTSVAAIIDEIGIAKGTFYHYFSSKEDLLDRIIERQVEKINLLIDEVLSNNRLNAVNKLNQVFILIGQYKVEKREVFIMMAKSLYSDSNIVLRDKIIKNRVKTVAKKISKIISQGITEGVFTTDSPDFTAEIIMQLPAYLGEEVAQLLNDKEHTGKKVKEMEKKFKAYENAVEKILGAQKGSICLFSDDIFKEFFTE